MPRASEGPSRPLNEQERANRQAFVALFPDKDAELPAFTSSYGEIESWIECGRPRTWPPDPWAPEFFPADEPAADQLPLWPVVQ
jgi:hypothetical protein